MRGDPEKKEIKERRDPLINVGMIPRIEKIETERNKGEQLINMGMTLISTHELAIACDPNNRRDRNKQK